MTSLPKRGDVKAAFSKAVIVDDGHGFIVVDTLYDADAGDILDEIKRIGRTPADIKHIVLTHAHRAHLGGLATLKRLSGAPTYAHPWEADIISGDRGRQEPSFFVLTPIQTYPIIFFGRLTSAFTKHKPLAVDHMIGEGDHIGPLQVRAYAAATRPATWSSTGRSGVYSSPGDAVVTWPMFTALAGAANSMLNHKQSREAAGRSGQRHGRARCHGVLSPPTARNASAATPAESLVRGKTTDYSGFTDTVVGRAGHRIPTREGTTTGR